ncbi:hypothetical protein Tco_1455157 [Tanacetum coccineum]
MHGPVMHAIATEQITTSAGNIHSRRLNSSTTLNKYDICTGIPELATRIKELNNIDAYVEMFSFKRSLATAAAATFF